MNRDKKDNFVFEIRPRNAPLPRSGEGSFDDLADDFLLTRGISSSPIPDPEMLEFEDHLRPVRLRWKGSEGYIDPSCSSVDGDDPASAIFVSDVCRPIHAPSQETVDMGAWHLDGVRQIGHLVEFLEAGRRAVRKVVLASVAGSMVLCVVPNEALAGEPSAEAKTPASDWDALTADLDPEAGSVPSYGVAAEESGSLDDLPSEQNATGAVGSGEWSSLVGQTVMVRTSTRTVVGGLMVVDDEHVMIRIPGVGVSNFKTGEIVSISQHTDLSNVHDATYGRGLKGGGIAMTAIGAASTVTGIVFTAISSSYFIYIGLPTILPGLAFMAAGIPMMIVGERRKKLRGTPKVNIAFSPTKRKGYTGGALVLRF